MGNKLLIACLPLLLVASQKYPDIDKLIEKVKVQRRGLSPEVIKKLKDPFIDEVKLKKIVIKQKILKKIKKQKLHLRLESIFNDRVKINARWYKVGSKVAGYQIVKIDYDKKSVLLKKGNKHLRLYLVKRKKRFRLVSGGKV